MAFKCRCFPVSTAKVPSLNIIYVNGRERKMKLARFIRENENRIMEAWTGSADENRSEGNSRVRDVLVRIATRLDDSLQSDETGQRSSERLSPAVGTGFVAMHAKNGGADSAASSHDLDELCSLMTSLRTALIRIWSNEATQFDAHEVLRLNEAVDELLTEAILTYVKELEHKVDDSDDVIHAASEQESADPANHDVLTGVANRRLFVDLLDQAVRLARRKGGLLALLHIDLDSFRNANEKLGHEGGDAVLQEVVHRIRSCIRDTDTMARMGGDEFAIALVDAGDKSHVEAVARAILTKLSRPYSFNAQKVQLSASIGIALHPENGSGIDDLLNHAARATLAARKEGGDQYSFQGLQDRAHIRMVENIGRPVRH